MSANNTATKIHGTPKDRHHHFSSCNNDCQCFDHRYPSYQSVSPCPYTQRGFLPAGSYAMTQEGAVYNYCKGTVMPKDALYVKTCGPKMGATMGSCIPRASDSSRLLMNTGSFTPYGVMGYNPRGCYL
jgi:hypothetical protein